MNRKEIGDWGEKKAAEYLIKKGYQVLEKNYRCRIGEIDIIAAGEGFTIFVEVKVRRTSDFGPPEAAVDYQKQQKIKKVANYYLGSNRILNKIRFDVISISIEGSRGKLKHIENAF